MKSLLYNTTVRRVLVLVVFAAISFSPLLPSAALGATGDALDAEDVKSFVEDVVDFVYTIALLVCVGILIYGGILMAFPGDDKNYAKGKGIVKNTAIALLVIFGVGVIVDTIQNFAEDPTGIF